MFLTPENSNTCLQGIHLPINLISDFFSSFFFLINKKTQTISKLKCSKMSPAYYTYFLLHQPMAAVADVLTDNENRGQLQDLRKNGSESTFYYKDLFLCTSLKVTQCHFYFYHSK